MSNDSESWIVLTLTLLLFRKTKPGESFSFYICRLDLFHDLVKCDQLSRFPFNLFDSPASTV